MPHELPDLFRFNDGSRVADSAAWPRRRAEIAAVIVPIEYGELPPASPPQALEVRRLAEGLVDGAEFRHYLVSIGTGPRFAFDLEYAFRTVVEKARHYKRRRLLALNDKIPREVLERGVILARFDRTMILPDDSDPAEIQGIRRVFPGEYGALAAWAWGYHRVVDVLLALPEVDASRIAVMGHSRGGKAALLAGATDERIAVTCARINRAVAARVPFVGRGEKSETLTDILRQFPHWFAPGLADFIGRENELPFDQHSLKALIAPRALLTTEALGDPWANPEGAWQTHRAAREVYRFLNAEGKLGIRFRAGPHDQTLMDWQALLDFMELVFDGRKPDASFTKSPFTDLPLAHSWRAPIG